MATESVLSQLGLFTTPEQYQQAQLRQLYQDQLAQAKLSPVEQASFNIGAGAQRAGDVLGRALGGEDPMLQMASRRQAIMQQVDQANPNSLAQAAQALNQAGDVQGARALYQAAQQRQAALTEENVKQSQIVRNMREGRAAANKVVEADGRQYLVNSVTGERIADLGKASDKSPKVTVAPEIKLPADINALASGYEKAIEGDVNVKNLAGNAKGLINQAATSNNPSAWEAARTQVAKAVGEGKLSNEDIARTGIDPTLIGGVRDWIEKKTVGVPDQRTQQALFVVASYLEKNASQRIAEKRNNRIKMAQQVNPNVDAASMFPDYSGIGQPSGGSGKVVDFKDLGRKQP